MKYYNLPRYIYIYIISDWWFGTFFIFPYIGNNHPIWLIFFRWVETTNQYIYNIMNVMDMMEYDGYSGYNTIWTNCTTYTHPYLRDFEILMLSSILPPNFLRRCWKRWLHESSEWHISQIWFKRNLPCPLEILFLAWWNHRMLCCWSTCAVSTTGSFDCRWSILDPPGNKMNRMNLAYGHVFILSHKVLILFMVDFTKVTKLTYL